MQKLNVLLLGFGEVGKAIYKIASKKCAISVIDKLLHRAASGKSFDVLLVAIPYSDEFVDTVKRCQRRYKIKTTIVFSTVPVGTCSKLRAVHSPIEGRHPNLEKSILIHRRWVGGSNVGAENFLKSLGFDLFVLDKPELTEFLKLRSLAYYGICIEFARYSKKVIDSLDENCFEYTKEYDKEYNRLYEKLGLFQFRRYVLDAPVGPIGGHCIVPNAMILDKQFPHPYLGRIYR